MGGGARSLTVPFHSGPHTVEVTPYEDVAFLLQQVPGIDVWRNQPPDPSMGSGSGYVFFRAKGTRATDVTANVAALVAALQADLDLLRALHVDEEA